MSKTVLIVDDHPLVCLAIRKALESIGFEAIGETSDGVHALQMIKSLQPSMVILDIGLEKIDGLTVLRRIIREKLDTRVLVYTSQSKETFAARCLQAGASGFVSKSEPIPQLIKAIETIADGHMLFPRVAMPHFTSATAYGSSGDLENLTDREMQVLIMLAEGFSNRAIAEKLNISSKTVSGHKVNLLMKLSVSSVVELGAIAKQHNLI
ncbi:two-component system response regulator EvgA [Pseudomonas chlororaphis]|uniref:response regulator n=1 Tax=Pseudomonas chlororaphis TaxID=587753 RepID=UPI00209E8BE0|nr:response regulator transcription factor [Pseudomonas chlororaphis]MCP1482000.1 two-component system response regulator EvgA [Pseudomonas chlororaphis]MCP1597641.1 two-component system response regulator EvgA [Pseudomonas chlororaphis]